MMKKYYILLLFFSSFLTIPLQGTTCQVTLLPLGGKKTTTLQVREETTFGVLKKEIKKKLNIPIFLQRLVYKGKAVDDDTKTLSDYSQDGQLQLCLVEKFFWLRVYMQCTQNKYNTSALLMPNDTVANLKKWVLKTHHSLLIEEIKLSFNGKAMEDNKRVFDDDDEPEDIKKFKVITLEVKKKKNAQNVPHKSPKKNFTKEKAIPKKEPLQPFVQSESDSTILSESEETSQSDEETHFSILNPTTWSKTLQISVTGTVIVVLTAPPLYIFFSKPQTKKKQRKKKIVKKKKKHQKKRKKKKKF